MAVEEIGETGGTLPSTALTVHVVVRALPLHWLVHLDALVVAERTTKKDRCDGVAGIRVADDWIHNLFV